MYRVLFSLGVLTERLGPIFSLTLALNDHKIASFQLTPRFTQWAFLRQVVGCESLGSQPESKFLKGLFEARLVFISSTRRNLHG
jgi:hypothetical protein